MKKFYGSCNCIEEFIVKYWVLKYRKWYASSETSDCSKQGKKLSVMEQAFKVRLESGHLRFEDGEVKRERMP